MTTIDHCSEAIRYLVEILIEEGIKNIRRKHYGIEFSVDGWFSNVQFMAEDVVGQTNFIFRRSDMPNDSLYRIMVSYAAGSGEIRKLIRKLRSL